MSIASRFDVLDVVEMELAPPMLTEKFQRENRAVLNWKWKVVGTVSADDVIELCEDTSPLLHGAGDRVSPQKLAKLPPSDWKSLQLIRPRQLRFSSDPWRAHFQDAADNLYALKVKDASCLDRLNAGKTPGSECLITVSLAGPWAPDDGSQPEFCYKLAAAVIEL